MEGAPPGLADLQQTRVRLAKDLAARTDPVFDALWASGEFKTADALDVKLLQDETGRPLPNSGRITPSGFQYIVLQRDSYPAEVDLFRTIHDLDREIKALETAMWLE